MYQGGNNAEVCAAAISSVHTELLPEDNRAQTSVSLLHCRMLSNYLRRSLFLENNCISFHDEVNTPPMYMIYFIIKTNERAAAGFVVFNQIVKETNNTL